MYYVVGSGPAGVMCALALLDRGCPVVLLDVGRGPDARAAALARTLSATAPEDWDPAETTATADELARITTSAGRKASLGSMHPYALDAMDSLSQHGTNCLISYARGGLSTVWGAGILPFSEEDFADWPDRARALAPHYEAVTRTIPIAWAPGDGLERWHRQPAGAEHATPLGDRDRGLIDRLDARRAALEAVGMSFAPARLAVYNDERAEEAGCRQCGLCLLGCPYGAIYSSADTLEQLLRRPGFEYRPGARVTRLRETGAGVEIEWEQAPRGDLQRTTADRVFVAAGALSSLRILAQSGYVSGNGWELAYSPYVMMPMLAERSMRGPIPTDELARAFLQVRQRRVSPFAVHVSLYGYNHLMRHRLSSLLGKRLGAYAERQMGGRILAGQAFLHSRVAPPISVSIENDSGAARVRLRVESSDRLRARLERVADYLYAHRRSTGLRPLLPLIEYGKPGDGNHVGGLFPMRATATERESDPLGRLAGLHRIHVVDGAVLPSVPAGLPTFTIMANAHRIGSEAA